MRGFGVFLNFGKYRGWEISELPLSYLAWLFENLDGRPDIQEAARAEIARRVSWDGWTPAPLDADRVRRVYRTLAMEYHPDKGGDTGVMQGINLFYEQLQNKGEWR